MTATGEPLEIQVGERGRTRVRFSCCARRRPWAGYVLAHGAGAGMTHPFMESVARALMARGIATLRYQFPYTESGGRRPDPPGVLLATVRAAVARARELLPSLKLFAGGKSLGGRMTSHAVAERQLEERGGTHLPGLPAPSAEASGDRARRAPRAGRPADAVPPGNPRRSGGSGRWSARSAPDWATASLSTWWRAPNHSFRGAQALGANRIQRCWKSWRTRSPAGGSDGIGIVPQSGSGNKPEGFPVGARRTLPTRKGPSG